MRTLREKSTEEQNTKFAIDLIMLLAQCFKENMYFKIKLSLRGQRDYAHGILSATTAMMEESH